MDDVLSDHVNLAAVPFCHGERVQHVEVFVIAVNKKQSELLLFKPVKPVFLSVAYVPDSAKADSSKGY